MYKVTTNAAAVASRINRGLAAMDAALRTVLRNLAIRINRNAISNLAGSNSDAPGSYPVPNRTGNLMRGQGWQMASNNRAAFIFNDRPYARAVHEGQESSAKFGRRPFLDDAAQDVDILGETQFALRASLLR